MDFWTSNSLNVAGFKSFEQMFLGETNIKTILNRFARQIDVADGCHREQNFMWNSKASDSVTSQHCSRMISKQATLLENISLHVDYLLGKALNYGFAQSPYL
jgi:hypothetical protein